jgi:type IV secretory pathway TraG/TraD family ATPase VirD4
MRILAALGALSAATQSVAAIFDYQSALGAPAARIAGVAVYWPWSVFTWAAAWRDRYPRPFALADLVVLAGSGGGVLVLAIAAQAGAPKLRRHGAIGWAQFADVRAAGLFAAGGAVLGKFDSEIIAYDGAGHLLLVGASRSGKGRGHVVPTLLAWPRSVLALDVKGELAYGDARHDFLGVAGFREELGPVLRFAPTAAKSARFNPLFEVRKGANEVRDVQNVVEAYKFLTPQAAAQLTQLAREDDPFLSLGRVGRTVHVRSVIARSDRSWEVTWIERSTNETGTSDPEVYSGVFTVSLRPPRTADDIAVNPLGLLISDFSWSRER